MQIKLIKATVRYSQDTGKGSWKSLELGAEADIAPNENWEDCQVDLYEKVTGQLRALWANGNGKHDGQEGHRTDAQPAQASTPPTDRQRFCVEHGQEWTKRTGPHGDFFSHRIGGKGSKAWCNEKTN